MPAGCWCLIEGVEGSLVNGDADGDGRRRRRLHLPPLAFAAAACLKLAAEPLHPSELPRMLEGLRKLNKAYPLLATKVEESAST